MQHSTSAKEVSAYNRLIDKLREHGNKVHEFGKGTDGIGQKAKAQCPNHDDNRASLSVTGMIGSVLIYCHAGCETTDVLCALGMDMRDLYDDRRGDTYHYPDGRKVHRSW